MVENAQGGGDWDAALAAATKDAIESATIDDVDGDAVSDKSSSRGSNAVPGAGVTDRGHVRRVDSQKGGAKE